MTAPDEFTSEALRARFAADHAIEVGLYSYGCFDAARIGRETTIGRYCSIAPSAHIFRRNHGIEYLALTPYFYNASLGLVAEDTIPFVPLVIEDDVWLGHNSIILPSCKRIGRGAIIAAGAVVTRDVEPYSLVAGNPARELRKRFAPDVIADIEATRWWERTPAELKVEYERDPGRFLSPALAL